MPQETERPIEKLLRAVVKKRRDEAGSSCDLHPATRRLLQAEVATQFRARWAKARLFEALRVKLKPGLAWGLAAGAAIIVGIWFLRPEFSHKASETLLAKNEMRTPLASNAQNTPPASTASVLTPAQPELRDNATATLAKATAVENRALLTLAEERSKANSESVFQRVQPAGTGTLPGSGGQPSAAAQSLATARETETLLSLNSKVEPQAYVPEAIPAPPPALASVAAGTPAATTPNLSVVSMGPSPEPANLPAPSALGSSEAVNLIKDHFQTIPATVPKEDFMRRAQLKANAAGRDGRRATQAVLASFQLEQSGQQLRIIDDDGSIYTGDFQAGAESAPAQSRRELDRERQPVVGGLVSTENLSRQTYAFRVSGTNVSLNQPVVFLGKLTEIANSNPPAEHATRAQIRGTPAFQAPAPKTSGSPAVTKRVSGMAIVGGKTEISIEAVSSSPVQNKN